TGRTRYLARRRGAVLVPGLFSPGSAFGRLSLRSNGGAAATEPNGTDRAAAARVYQGAFEPGGGGHVRDRLRRVVRVHQPLVSRHYGIDRRGHVDGGRNAAVRAGADRGRARRGAGRFGVLLDRPPLRLRPCPAVAVQPES